MVLGVVDAIHSDGIDAELLEIWQVALAGAAIGKRVNVSGGLEEGIAGRSYDCACSKSRQCHGHREPRNVGPCSWYATPLI